MFDTVRPHIEAGAEAGCQNVAQLWRELTADGFKGSYRSVLRVFSALCRTVTSKAARKAAPPRIQASETRSLCRLLVEPVRGCSVGPHVESMRQPVPSGLSSSPVCVSSSRSSTPHETWHFRLVLIQHERDIGGSDRWLAQARRCAVVEMHRFAAGMEADLSAVRAAITSP